MSEDTLYEFQQRYDLPQNWASNNPILPQGVLGFESNTLKFKLGDGATRWNDLPYASSPAVSGGDMAKTDFFKGLGSRNTNYIDHCAHGDNAPLSVREFGAKGDGSSDDTDAIQLAIAYAYGCGGRSIYLPGGTYCISRPLYIWGGVTYDSLATRLIGDAVNTAVIRKTTHNPTGDGTACDGIDAILICVNASKDLSQDTYRVELSNMYLDGKLSDTDLCAYGIYMPGEGADLLFDSITVRAQTGVQFAGNIWQSNFKNITMWASVKGFSMLRSGTSNHIDKAFVVGSSVYAYELRGDYSTASALAADSCTGVIYYFAYGSWSVNGLGNESSPNATCTVKTGQEACITLKSVGFGCHDGADAAVFSPGNYSILTVIGGRIGYSGAIHAGALYDLNAEFTKLSLKDVFIGDKFTRMPTVYSVKNQFVFSDNRGSFGLRENMPFLGVDVAGNDATGVVSPKLDYWMTSPAWDGRALFLSVDTVRLGMNGEAVGYSQKPQVGDVFLTKNVASRGVLGWVCVSNAGATYQRDCTFWGIPAYTYGPTANRPVPTGNTWLEPGIMYFDTDLGKPVWWNGSAHWVDGTGAVV
ncbi:MAG: glycosyl hydrolase family 28-related protein [Ethanoligenens sp.]|uniref:glycosyl hydrolase family 28-related protein n=1 Tax=Ethanoligenens sp. TaxID=2099655 RepID=UPI0039E97520